jgi:hypothetical protein
MATERRLQTLIEEYKEMRAEIRATYGQYFSILFGVILSGIAVSFHLAFSDDNGWLFLFIPFMLGSWFAILTMIRSNVQHISNYIKKKENEINEISDFDFLFYERQHVSRLWDRKLLKILSLFKVIGFIVVIPVIGVLIVSVAEGVKYLKLIGFDKYSFFLPCVGYIDLFLDDIFKYSASALFFVTICLFFIIPWKVKRGDI